MGIFSYDIFKLGVSMIKRRGLSKFWWRQLERRNEIDKRVAAISVLKHIFIKLTYAPTRQ